MNPRIFEHFIRVGNGVYSGLTGHDMRQRSPYDKSLFLPHDCDIHTRHKPFRKHSGRTTDTTATNDNQFFSIFHDDPPLLLVFNNACASRF
jgi:hypothetical protein